MFAKFIARLAIAIAMLLIGLIAGVIAVGYFAYGVYLGLLNVLIPPAAAGITGAVVLAAAILLLGLLRAISRPRRARGRRRDAAAVPSLEDCENAAEVGSELGRKLRGLTGANASGGLLAALVAGFAVGVSPKLRAFLQAILKP